MGLREQIDKTLDEVLTDRNVTRRLCSDATDAVMGVVEPEIERLREENTTLTGQVADYRATLKQVSGNSNRLRLAWQSARQGRRSARLLTNELLRQVNGLWDQIHRDQHTAMDAHAALDRVRALLEADEQCGPSVDRGITCPNIRDLEAALDQGGDQEGAG